MSDSSKCSRCGKQRILLKKWQEEVATSEGTSILTYTQYVCPDEGCQKLTEKALKLQHDQSVAREQANLEREQVRNELRKNSRKKE